MRLNITYKKWWLNCIVENKGYINSEVLEITVSKDDWEGKLHTGNAELDGEAMFNKIKKDMQIEGDQPDAMAVIFIIYALIKY